jgi:hypothetical protein
MQGNIIPVIIEIKLRRMNTQAKALMEVFFSRKG